MKKGSKIVVAVDESEESTHALSWCLKNLVPSNSNTTLFLLYVKPPPPPVYSLFDAAGLVFSGDVVANVINFGTQSVQSVMERAEAVCRNFHGDVSTLLS
uniref:UspA domain-containing protein n=1 Tax=Rhizophora mucronata TaxID=61149 RepID=A0A2P2L0G8_RHIMU